MIRIKFCCWLAGLLILSSLVYPVKKDTKLILDQLQKLEEIISSMEQKITIFSSEFSTMYKKVNMIQEKVDAISKSQADSSQDKENVLMSLQFIKEEITELKNDIGRINDRLVNIPTPTTLVNSGISPSENKNISNPVQSGQTIPTQSPETIYYTAYSDYIKKNYDLAIEGFKQFNKLFPENALTDNAFYWIGECYYTKKMYQEAINTFTELITRFNNGDKIADASLKKGFSLIEMGKQAEGISVLKELISKFPLSDEARLAEQRIKEVSE